MMMGLTLIKRDKMDELMFLIQEDEEFFKKLKGGGMELVRRNTHVKTASTTSQQMRRKEIALGM